MGLVAPRHVRSGPAIEPMSPALENRFLTTGPQEKYPTPAYILTSLNVCLAISANLYLVQQSAPPSHFSPDVPRLASWTHGAGRLTDTCPTDMYSEQAS